MTGRSRRAEIFVTAEPDRRFDTRATGDERAMLADFLAAQRATLEIKCAGPADLRLSRRAVPPSTLSPLGFVRHLADVERRWFRAVLAGQGAPLRFSPEADPDGDFDGAAPDPDAVAAAWAAWAAWREEVGFADRFVAAAPGLDVVGRGVRPPQRPRRSAPRGDRRCAGRVSTSRVGIVVRPGD